MKRRAFTLIELLTVMAITAVLMGIIVVPLVQSFNMTRTAQAFADAQDRARILTEKIAQEVGGAVSVRSGAAQVISRLNGVADVRLPQNSLIVEVPGQNGATVELVMAYTKLDIIKPAEGDPTVGPNGGYINPSTGLEDPTLTAPKGQVSVPVVPGQTIVRYFIGRRDPFQNYNNPYDSSLMARNAQQDNLYVLYRAEVQPVLPGGAPNTEFFDVDVNNKPVLDDPRFFTPNRDGSGNIISNDAHAERIKNWLGLGGSNTIVAGNTTRRAVVMTEVSRYDMLQPTFSAKGTGVVYDGNAPRMVPLVQFHPSRVTNEPAQGQVAARPGEETANSGAVAPSVYTTAHNLWDRALVRNWPRGWDPNNSATNSYNVARGNAQNGMPGFPMGLSIYAYDPDYDVNDFDSGKETFDIYTYEQQAAKTRNFGGPGPYPYPFYDAVKAADSRSEWLSDPDVRDTFVAFTVNAARGFVRADFSISEVGDPTRKPANLDPDNLPYKDTTFDGNAYTPFNDPDTSGNFWQKKNQPINDLFNKVWVSAPNLQPNIHRFIDLRVTPNADGTMGPLNPSTGFNRASIVPGSEEVYGPDQMPGAHYGGRIRYTRTTQTPGPNQYRINYVDQNEPSDYTLLGLTAAQLTGFNPNTYDAKNFASAIIQPRFKKGYVQLNSDPNVPLPSTVPVTVAYRFQFNGAGGTSGAREDIFAVDYDTRQLIDVMLTMRNYPQSSLPNAQTVTLKSTASVRNYVR